LGLALEPAIERSEAMTAKVERFKCGKELLWPQSGLLKQTVRIWLAAAEDVAFVMNCLA